MFCIQSSPCNYGTTELKLLTIETVEKKMLFAFFLYALRKEAENKPLMLLITIILLFK